MNWKTKARIQNMIASLPGSLSYNVYYYIQRNLGELKSVNPERFLKTAVEMVQKAEHFGSGEFKGRILEVGTGRRIIVPLGLWLCGADEIITVDLNPYLTEELVFEDLHYMKSNPGEIKSLFGEYSKRPKFTDRWVNLMHFDGRLSELLKTLNIQYISPGDAADLDLKDASIDYQVSYTVFEHIPTDILGSIIREACRILKHDGLMIHKIDFSDHFAYSDPAISSINFLQFTDIEWSSLAGNRYMYHNRLRFSEYRKLFERNGAVIREIQPYSDPEAFDLLGKSSFNLAEKFRLFEPEDLAISRAWFTAGIDTKTSNV